MYSTRSVCLCSSCALLFASLDAQYSYHVSVDYLLAKVQVQEYTVGHVSAIGTLKFSSFFLLPLVLAITCTTHCTH